MDDEKKRILKSYKNEQEVIDDIHLIKDEKDSRANESVSGYHEEKYLDNGIASKDNQGNSSDSGYNAEKKNKK